MLINILVHVCAFKYIPKETQGAQRDVHVSVERQTILVSGSSRPASETSQRFSDSSALKYIQFVL